MLGFRRFNKDDVARWRAAGWVTADGENAISAELEEAGWNVRLPAVLATLGVVLLGFAAMSFVAANWQDMSRLARLGILMGALWASYGVAGWLAARNLGAFANAAVLLGVAIFGASIMLIAQMYHIDGNPPDAVLTWAVGSFLAGLAFNSRTVQALSMLLIALWSGWESGITNGVHWWFLPAWLAVTATFVLQRWMSGLWLAGLVLALWLIALGYLLGGEPRHEIVLSLGLLLAGASVAFERGFANWREEAGIFLFCGIGVAYAGLFGMQFIEDPGTAVLVVMSAVTLCLLLAVVAWSIRSGHRSVLWLAYAAFSAHILGLYFKTVGTLMGSSLFFLSSGVIVIGLAWAAYRLSGLQPSDLEVRS